MQSRRHHCRLLCIHRRPRPHLHRNYWRSMVASRTRLLRHPPRGKSGRKPRHFQGNNAVQHGPNQQPTHRHALRQPHNAALSGKKRIPLLRHNTHCRRHRTNGFPENHRLKGSTNKKKDSFSRDRPFKKNQ